MTALLNFIRETILIDGPISVERYMTLCLARYYGSRDPLGSAGDFTTAPEISQMFGELIGLWMAEIWRLMGEPPRAYWVELGPGRGTLSSDALRAARLLPEFLNGLDVHLVETSPVLRNMQKEVLSGTGKAVEWHDSVRSLPDDGPLLVVANEFFDALPVQQYVADKGQWHQRCVGLAEDEKTLRFGLFPSSGVTLPLPPKEGETCEVPASGIALMGELARRIARQGGVALVIDYGYAGPSYGDSLQALRHHAYADVLSMPGEADLTTHVGFQYLADAAYAGGTITHGLSTQRDFLRQLGIDVRAASLAKAAPAEAEAIFAAAARLTGEGRRNMGELFKVMAVSSPRLPEVPGLARCDANLLRVS